MKTHSNARSRVVASFFKKNKEMPVPAVHVNIEILLAARRWYYSVHIYKVGTLMIAVVNLDVRRYLKIFIYF